MAMTCSSHPNPRPVHRYKSSRHAQQPRNVHEVKCQMKADDEEPEMPLAQRLAHHPARHLRIPVVKGPEKYEDDRSNQNIVEMRHDEIGVVQLPVQRAPRKA